MAVIRWHAIVSAGVIRQPVQHARDVHHHETELGSHLNESTEAQDLVHTLIATVQVGHSVHRSNAIAVDN